MSPLPREAPILLVEDDEDDFFFMKRALEAAGVEQPVEIAWDGRQAIERLQRRPLPPLVFLDLKLPMLSGFEVLEWMHERKLPCVTIVLTSSTEPGDVRRAYGLCAHAYLAKPNSHEELVSLLWAVKVFWLERNLFCS